jgi:ribosomal protein L20
MGDDLKAEVRGSILEKLFYAKVSLRRSENDFADAKDRIKSAYRELRISRKTAALWEQMLAYLDYLEGLDGPQEEKEGE